MKGRVLPQDGVPEALLGSLASAGKDCHRSPSSFVGLVRGLRLLYWCRSERQRGKPPYSFKDCPVQLDATLRIRPVEMERVGRDEPPSL